MVEVEVGLAATTTAATGFVDEELGATWKYAPADVVGVEMGASFVLGGDSIAAGEEEEAAVAVAVATAPEPKLADAVTAT
jgi:hypothetical protein